MNFKTSITGLRFPSISSFSLLFFLILSEHAMNHTVVRALRSACASKQLRLQRGNRYL